MADEHELKLMALRCFLIGVFCSIFAVVFFYILMEDIIISEFASIGILIGTFYISIVVYKRDWFNEKIGLFDPYFREFLIKVSLYF